MQVRASSWTRWAVPSTRLADQHHHSTNGNGNRNRKPGPNGDRDAASCPRPAERETGTQFVALAPDYRRNGNVNPLGDANHVVRSQDSRTAPFGLTHRPNPGKSPAVAPAKDDWHSTTHVRSRRMIVQPRESQGLPAGHGAVRIRVKLRPTSFSARRPVRAKPTP
jgi:hypothetical protein